MVLEHWSKKNPTLICRKSENFEIKLRGLPQMANPQDDISQVVILLEANPYFWGERISRAANSAETTGFTFDRFLEHVLLFINSLFLLNQANRVVVIATGATSCAYLYDSQASEVAANARTARAVKKQSVVEKITQKLEDFMSKEAVCDLNQGMEDTRYSLLSGSLSMALCYIQKVLRGAPPHPRPRILCLQGSPDAPPQYVTLPYIAIMNAIFSAQRSLVPIDACLVGDQPSAFLQQATHITGGIYQKPSTPEGLFEYLAMVFATDLYSRKFLQLPGASGVDFRASCFCHKKSIDMGFVCSVCLSIFCKGQRTCTTCNANFAPNKPSATGQKPKAS
ncbi:hypothetical protein R1sor_015806 [Riccia sorocarpa]|uniref:General transcription and DNA repair factor IIH subunit TFB4 n=1 Tax=Riccia sorocarpa TaxID=122646 RepID=A0ABD3HG02_9MARC